MVDSFIPSLELDGERTILLTVDEINALTRRGVWSRLSFSAFVAAVACSVIAWQFAIIWLCAVFVWELAVRRALERWTTPAWEQDRSDRALLKLAPVHAFGAAIYASMGAAGFLSKTTIGDQLAMSWIAGAAIHTFVYFSNRRPLLLANLATPVLVALTAPSIAAGGFAWQAALITILTLALVAAAALFAAERNVLLVSLSNHINARRAAEEANAAKAQFLRTISHELRTPLNVVIGYSELLEEELADMGADQQRADASHITTAGKHLLVLIGDILQVAQQEANAPLLRLDKIDTAALVNDIEAMAKVLCAEGDNRFVIEAAPLQPLVLDRIKLMDCLSKLVSNACRFTNNGLITVRVWNEVDQVAFEVTDTGIGIAPKALTHLFEPFVHTRQYECAGLSLAVARKNARLMGGDISVESLSGHGSTFTLWLPCTLLAGTLPTTQRAPHSQFDVSER